MTPLIEHRFRSLCSSLSWKESGKSPILISNEFGIHAPCAVINCVRRTTENQTLEIKASEKGWVTSDARRLSTTIIVKVDFRWSLPVV